ncbi:MAG: DUF3137 domain-containing protein [Bacteroidota bacterium]
MERIKNFDSFYELNLKPYIDELQQQNKKADRWGIGIIVFAFALIPVIIYGISGSSGNFGKFLIVLMVALVVISARNYAKISNAFETNFKEQVVKQIIDFIQPGLVYKPDVYMSSSYFRNSGLFINRYNVYDGDDMIEGVYKNVSFKCSELNVYERRSRGTISAVFHGLFFAAPVSRKFNSGTYIYKKDGEQYLPAFGMPGIVRLDCSNGEFENYHSVFTTNVKEASIIMNQEMMQRLTGFMSQIRRSVTMSVVAGMCYVAIPFSQDLFEPPGPYESNKEEIKEYFFTVLLILSIINQLKLERLQ